MFFPENVRAFFDRYPDFKGLEPRTQEATNAIAAGANGMVTTGSLEEQLGHPYGVIAQAIGVDVGRNEFGPHLAIIAANL